MNAAEESNIIQLPTNDSQSPEIHPLNQADQEPASSGNIEKIRDILFGAQMRDYDRQFIRLEEKLLKESADLREETRRRLDSLENYVKQELTALNDRLKIEHQQRSQLTDEMTRELRETSRSIGQKIGHLEEQALENHREVREHILTQSKDLADEIRRKHDEISTALTRETRELRHDKTDRIALSNLFTELALRLNHEFKLPGDD